MSVMQAGNVIRFERQAKIEIRVPAENTPVVNESMRVFYGVESSAAISPQPPLVWEMAQNEQLVLEILVTVLATTTRNFVPLSADVATNVGKAV